MRVRRRGESLSDLAYGIKKMTRKAYPTATPDVCEQLTMNAFVDVLDDA